MLFLKIFNNLFELSKTFSYDSFSLPLVPSNLSLSPSDLFVVDGICRDNDRIEGAKQRGGIMKIKR